MSGHVHSLKPNRPVLPTVFACSSCAFRCTPEKVAEVKANPGRHRVVKPTDPQAKEVWGR